MWELIGYIFFSKALAKFGGLDFIGSGPEYGTAWYCQAVFEAIGKLRCMLIPKNGYISIFIRELDQTATVVFAGVKSPAMSQKPGTFLSTYIS